MQSWPQTATVSSSQCENGNASTPVQGWNRYTPTYKSNAFSHAEYKPPIKDVDSAADWTLRTTGTSIEDYGRRDVAPRLEQLYSNSPIAQRKAKE